MIGAKVEEARTASYELEIEIAATPERVWTAIFDETNAWWLPDCHVAGADSVVTFDAQAGGHLLERTPDGGGLLWYTVQWINPAAYSVHLFGHISPEYGGPSTSHLRLVVEAADDGRSSVLKVSDAHVGNVDEKRLADQSGGWKMLFGDGLKSHVERN